MTIKCLIYIYTPPPGFMFLAFHILLLQNCRLFFWHHGGLCLIPYEYLNSIVGVYWSHFAWASGLEHLLKTSKMFKCVADDLIWGWKMWQCSVFSVTASKTDPQHDNATVHRDTVSTSFLFRGGSWVLNPDQPPVIWGKQLDFQWLKLGHSWLLQQDHDPKRKEKQVWKDLH